MNTLPATRRERLYYVIKKFNGSVVYYDVYLNILLTEKEFSVLQAHGYYDNLTLKYDNYVEQ